MWPRSQRFSLLTSLLLLAAGGARGDAEVRGRLLAERIPQGAVYVENLPAQTAPDSARAVMKQQHLKFVPQVLPVLAGTTVEFVNADEMAHNVFSPTPQEMFDLGTFGLGTRSHLFRSPGAHVILCNVHVEMVAWVLVLKNPFFASLEHDGSFRLRLPPGKHRLVLWRPREPEVVREVLVPESGAVELEWRL
jgi:plastocyanin